MQKKIIILTLDITLQGGIERVVSNMANMFEEYTDYKVKIISAFSKFDKPFYKISPNVDIEYLYKGAPDISSFWKKIKTNIYNVWNLRKLKEDNNIVISTFTNMTLWLILLRKHRQYYLIAAEHANYHALSKLVQIGRKHLYKHVDAVVTLVESEMSFYKPFSKKVVCIPNSLAIFPDAVTHYTSKRVIAAGRAVKEKGFDRLLYIYNILGEKYKDWSFDLFASDGYLIDQLKEIHTKSPSNVHLLPPTTKLLEKMQESDIYVCTSTTESFSMVILEAMSCGVCPVSYDCPSGPRALISDCKDGYLVELGNEKELIERVSQLIENEDLRKTIGRNARQKAEYFVPQNVCCQWANLINTIDLFRKYENKTHSEENAS